MPAAANLYPVDAPFNSGMLPVSDLHTLAFAEYGTPQGLPAVYLHGGPGAGCTPDMAGFFNPQKYRVVLFDQRGCGNSTPHAELRDNTTWALTDDLEKLRQHLHIKQWLVAGGSWGSTLALAYAQQYPAAVAGLVLRGIFTLRRRELLWFYQEGANWLYPDLWEEFAAPIPAAERGDMMGAYYRRLTGGDRTAQAACALAWSRWEAATLSMHPSAARVAQFSDPRFALSFARIECHYFVNGGFFSEDGQLLTAAAKLAAIPGVIIHGRYDTVTPLKTAWELSHRWPQARLQIVADAGHAASEPGIAAALRQATDEFAA